MKYEKIKLSIAKKIKSLREEQGLNQRELAKKAGVSQKTISNLENTNTSTETCNLDKLTAVAEALKVNVSYLFEDEKAIPKNLEIKENYSAGLKSKTFDLAKKMEDLTPEQQALIEQTINMFKNTNPKSDQQAA